MIRTASFRRAFFEAGLPAWLIFAALFIIQRGERGLSGFSIFFIPIWGALRLKQPDKPKMEQIIYYGGFCLAQCAVVLVVAYAAGFVLYVAGTIPGPSSWTPLISSVTSLIEMILIPFFMVRGVLGLLGAIYQTEKPVKSVPSAEGDRKRLFAIDAVRGWVMIFMALDHAMYFCYIHVFAEGFQGLRPDPLPDAAHYLTRFITHYCAPTFIFLAGLSVALYTLSRHNQLTEGHITKKLLTRGILLILIQMAIINWVWGYGLKPGWSIVYFGILACIGSGLIVLAFARRIPVSLLAGGSVVLLLVVPFLLYLFPPVSGVDEPLLEILLQPDSEGWLSSLYPVLPWLSVMGLGCACGFLIGANPERITKLFLGLGVILLVGWLFLRLGGGYGNLTLYQGGDWRDFMLMSKYPPSLVFLFWNLGGMAIAIAGHNYFYKKLPFKQFWNIITLFGQTPLFFYVVHLYLFKLLSYVPVLTGSLTLGYVAWLVGLVMMIPLCKGYQRLEKKYPDSVLQYI